MLKKAKSIKAIFFDIDGTLYDHEFRDFPLSTKKVLPLLDKQGYQLFIATSRSEQEMLHVWDLIRQYPFAGVISCGGAMTRIRQDVSDVKYMDPEDVQKVLAYCREHQIDVRWQSMNACFFDAVPGTIAKDAFMYFYHMIPDTRPWQGEPILNLLCFAVGEEAKALASLTRNSSVVYYGDSVEFTSKGISKASAIVHVAKTLGLDMDEVAAFGDGENDETMLREAGIGIAMGNGTSIAKEAADFVTGHIREDGLADACLKMGWIDEGVLA